VIPAQEFVVRLNRTHAIDGFDCGNPEQTSWLIKHAFTADRNGQSRVYVAARADHRVLGYVALSSGPVTPADAPSRVMQGQGSYPVPIALLTRLGVDVSVQGMGLGRLLLRHALDVAADVADRIGIRVPHPLCERGCSLVVSGPDLRLRAFTNGSPPPLPVDEGPATLQHRAVSTQPRARPRRAAA
jgi:GNAT superfamily N-acetyltransferase